MGEPRSRVACSQEAFARLQGAQYEVACANGSAAIAVVLKALGVGPGDEVIVPPYTFIATDSAALMNTAVPIFADIDPETFNMSFGGAEQAIMPNTRAIAVVHFAGYAAGMNAFLQIATRDHLILIEGAAHVDGATWRGQGLGSIGKTGTFSFQASKNVAAVKRVLLQLMTGTLPQVASRTSGQGGSLIGHGMNITAWSGITA